MSSNARNMSAIAIAVSASALAGCHVHSVMSEAQIDSRSPPDDKALVWFIRGPNPNDNSDLADLGIADDSGHFVAMLGRLQRVAIVVAPGRHVYFAFRDGGARMNADEEGALAPPAIIVEAASNAVYGIEANLLGEEKAFATFAPISPRFGRDEAYLRSVLRVTAPYAVNANEADVFNRTRATEYSWSHEWQRGNEVLQTYDAVALENHTLHLEDSFR